MGEIMKLKKELRKLSKLTDHMKKDLEQFKLDSNEN